MKPNENKTSLICPRTLLLAGLVLAAVVLRVVPHPFNFAPIGALAIFGGATFRSKRLALTLPLLSLVAGDVAIGFYRLMFVVYASFLLSVAIGFWLRKGRSPARIGIATLAGAIQFFLVTNFAVWASSIGTYPKTFAGLIACYAAGVPYFWNTLAGDAFYAAVLFGGLALAEWRFPSLREPLPAAGIK